MKIIRTENEYEAALKRVEAIMDLDSPSNDELDEMELLVLLIEKYEAEHYPISAPDPVEYLKFIMEKDGLTKKDLAKYIGNLSKVSEVLSYKVKLSLNMIQNLHEGLDIPLDVLSQAYGKKKESQGKYPAEYYGCFNELVKRDYFPGFNGTLNEAKRRKDELLETLINGYTMGEQCYCRKTKNVKIDHFALFAWQCRIKQLLSSEQLPDFKKDKLPKTFLRDVAKLSYYTDGCKLVKEHLNKFGIHFIILKHLPKTNLDGAVFMFHSHPVVALTLRHNREDNFWFTLLHELAHVILHLKDENTSFFDDTADEKKGSIEDIEKQANKEAQNALFPSQIWNQYRSGNDTVSDLSNKLQVAPSIIAGRIRFEAQDYQYYSNVTHKNDIREKLGV
ncbi:MAG: ImmA/IrrE family metallo-endopeptidase [Verrucomicrobia bacterium]|nr:ImmA/IrrE family metallo-endopeptidase [Verrucomicrobiota bacterium]